MSAVAVIANTGVPPDDERQGLPSASSGDMMYHCEASRQAQDGLPPLPEAETTTDGTIIHDAMYTGSAEVDARLTMTQKQITDKLRGMEAEAVEKWKGDFQIKGEIQIWREERFWLRKSNLEQYASAKPDFACMGKDGVYGLVLNFKTGFMRVTPSPMSWQSRIEALSFWHEIQQRRPMAYIRAGFVASRLYSSIDVTEYQSGVMPEIEREYQRILWRSEQKDARRVPGPWCRYCRASAGYCKEYAAYTMIALPDAPAGIKKRISSLDVVEAVGMMSPFELGRVFRRRALLASMMEAIKERMKALPAAELKETGFELVEGKRDYPIDDPAAAFKLLVAFLGEEDALKCLDVVRGRAETLLYERGGMTHDEVKAKIIEVLGLKMVRGEKQLKPL